MIYLVLGENTGHLCLEKHETTVCKARKARREGLEQEWTNAAIRISLTSTGICFTTLAPFLHVDINRDPSMQLKRK
jgi:hypothetical protein